MSARIRLSEVRLTEYDANGFLGLQFVGDGDEDAAIPTVEALSAYGFIGRPLDPTVDAGGTMVNGAQALIIDEGDESFALALHDSRVVPGLAALQKGESVQYGPATNFVRCHADGRVSTMCTTDGTPNGYNVVSECAPDGHRWHGPWGKLSHDANGLQYRHKSGASWRVGGIAGLPAPFAALGSYAILEVGTCQIKTSACQIGSGVFEPVSKALVNLEVLGLIATAHTAQATADTAVGLALNAILADLTTLLGPGNPTSTAPAGAATAALTLAVIAHGGAVASVAAAATTLPSRSLQVS